MKVLRAQGEISAEGKLRLEVLCDLPPGPAEVVIVIQPKRSFSSPPYDTLQGILGGKLPKEIDVKADLREMNRQWEESIGLPDE